MYVSLQKEVRLRFQPTKCLKRSVRERRAEDLWVGEKREREKRKIGKGTVAFVVQGDREKRRHALCRGMDEG